MKHDKLYPLFTACIPIKGHNRSLIMDLHRHKVHNIPNPLYNILLLSKTTVFRDVLKGYTKSEQKIVQEYFHFLLENELIFEADKSEIIRFPDLSLEWDVPSLCNNAIIDITKELKYDLKPLIKQLDTLNCLHIQIRIFDVFDVENLVDIVSFCNALSFNSIQLLLPYSNKVTENFWVDLMKKYKRLSKIDLFNCPENKEIQVYGVHSIIFCHIQLLRDATQCGSINTAFFSVTMDHFTESQAHNTCLNRKLCIDAEGNIKNCPAMERSFGNIKDTTLQEAIEKPGFKDLWFIHKDLIDVCKDCEFRHMCTDCRCFIKDPENIYSQPAKCTYNPYICKWENEEGYVPVEECGSYNRETGFVPDHGKIKELNKQIWGEDDE